MPHIIRGTCRGLQLLTLPIRELQVEYECSRPQNDSPKKNKGRTAYWTTIPKKHW